MANQEHLRLLKQGVDAWNLWRKEHPEIQPDLSSAKLIGTNLSRANLVRTNLTKANLTGTNLTKANLTDANLSEANLSRADLSRARLCGAELTRVNLSNTRLISADLTGANLRRATITEATLARAKLKRANLSKANLTGANLTGANLTAATLIAAKLSRADLTAAILNEATLAGAGLTNADLSRASLTNTDLSRSYLNKTILAGTILTGTIFSQAKLIGANLTGAILVGTDLTNTILNDCTIYGISAWDVQLEGAAQLNLIITPQDQPIITVDNLKVAQFIYLLLNNQEIRDVIDTITSKVVLILGRFTSERKEVLDSLRSELRKHNYSPILFDFEKPVSRDLTETVSILAHLARFIIVDLTDPSSVPFELATIIPHCIVPVQPLLAVQPLLTDEKTMANHVIEENSVERHEFVLFQDPIRRYHWVLPIFHYQDTIELLSSLKEHVIDPAEQKAKELARQK